MLKLKVLKPVKLNIDGKGYKVYNAGQWLVIENTDYITSNNLVERYSKFPKHIQLDIAEEAVEEDVEETEIEDIAEEDVELEESVEEEDAVDLSKLKNAELKELCSEKGIDFKSKAKNEELIALLTETE